MKITPRNCLNRNPELWKYCKKGTANIKDAIEMFEIVYGSDISFSNNDC